MNQIKIGTCIPGNRAVEWLPHFAKYDFETFSLNFHMSFGELNIEEFAPKALDMIKDSDATFDALGFYSNPLQNKEHFAGPHPNI